LPSLTRTALTHAAVSRGFWEIYFNLFVFLAWMRSIVARWLYWRTAGGVVATYYELLGYVSCAFAGEKEISYSKS
jgi:hypothetical protein